MCKFIRIRNADIPTLCTDVTLHVSKAGLQRCITFLFDYYVVKILVQPRLIRMYVSDFINYGDINNSAF